MKPPFKDPKSRYLLGGMCLDEKLILAACAADHAALMEQGASEKEALKMMNDYDLKNARTAADATREAYSRLGCLIQPEAA